ncbi:MAG TPA: hypothetical protein DCE42_09150 [Myxococcales bacterium]|nr:hypothetical protein [Deltaproteobacteria bacterium]HAA54912.1 hypothetical protein [Myxococcales bacterium]|tara:strand:+ start:4794 stop:5885 length:1092 start_codon:yes stop_codon:yes gene_type:complete
MAQANKLATLRDLVSQPPSQDLWWDIVELFDTWEESDALSVGVEYANAHMASWPDRWRIVPYYWADVLLGGDKAFIKRKWKRGQRTHPAMPIVRCFQTENWPKNHRGEKGRIAFGKKQIKHWGKAKQLQNITRVSFSGASLEDEGAFMLSEQWPDLPALAYLDLQSNSIGPQGMWDLSYAGVFDGLRFLSCRENRFGDEGLRAILECPGLSSLEGLDIHNIHITEEGLGDIRESETLSGLRWFATNGYWTEYANAFTLMLRDAPFASTLETLLISNSYIDTRKMKLIAETTFPRLKTIDISYNPMDEEGLRILAESDAFPALERVEYYIYDPKQDPERVELLKNVFGDKLVLGYSPIILELDD